MDEPWRTLASRQAGMLSREQLRALGFDRCHVRNQVQAGRWRLRTPLVVSTTTGQLTWAQRAWMGVLHAGPASVVGGLSAAKIHGLTNWERPDVTVLVPATADIPAVEGIDFVRTRRHIEGMKLPGTRAPVCRLEPAVLLYGAYTESPRTAGGLLAAVVQQRLTTPDALLRWIGLMQPLRRARFFRDTLEDIAGGAQSMAEIDVGKVCRKFGLPAPTRQVRRREEASGLVRYTDCEWRLRDGRVVVLEVDGSFHMDVEHWGADMARERGLVVAGSVVLRCTALELRRDPQAVVRDLRAAGVGATHQSCG